LSSMPMPLKPRSIFCFSPIKIAASCMTSESGVLSGTKA
jgi:hypothetical protein